MHEVRFSNIYILPHIIYYIHPLTIIITLTIKAVGFFAMHYGDIRYDLFLFGIFHYFRLKRLLLHGLRDEKKTQKHGIYFTL